MAEVSVYDEEQSVLHLANRLSESRSPYVRQHMTNPVAWQMWDAEALALAKKHNRMLFLSIGYASCHWCHVMERESFSTPEVAALLNDNFIPIKLDREERPDLDAIYMNYVQATSGSAGWPLNVFLTPDLEPVFGGTYWPGPNASLATAGTALAETVKFVEILEKIKTVWIEQESRCRLEAKEITQQLRSFAEEGVYSDGEEPVGPTRGDGPELELLETAYRHLEHRFDKTNGGFAAAPKFPMPVNLNFLLRLSRWPSTVKAIVGDAECDSATNMALTTLRKMARGGIRDQIGYGFARYSVTTDWSLPHFEKMLYDQAQLLAVYLDAFLVTCDAEMLGAVYDLATYLTTAPISAPHGGFFSAEDADSLPRHTSPEKTEGAFYVWTLKEVSSMLGPRDADIVARFYGISPDGNIAPANDPHDEFINQNVPSIITTPTMLAQTLSLPESTVTSVLKSARQKMRERRDATRPRPALDDKIVVSWNGLAISALARTAAALEFVDPVRSSSCLTAALSAVSFVRRELFDESTETLYRIYSRGARGSTQGLCDDYAFLIAALIDLYETTFDDTHLAFADTLQKIQLERFRDTDSPHTGGFYTTPSPHPPDLLLRLKSGMDSTEPSCNNISASNLYRLGSMLNDDSYTLAAKRTILAFEAEIEQFPLAFAGMLGSVIMERLGVQEVVLMGEDVDEAVLKRVRERLRPGRTVVRFGGGKGEWLKGRNPELGAIGREKRGVMVCERGVCREGGVEILD